MVQLRYCQYITFMVGFDTFKSSFRDIFTYTNVFSYSIDLNCKDIYTALLLSYAMKDPTGKM